MSFWLAVALTVLIIAASAFFVIIEFSLLAAKRHRVAEGPQDRSTRATLRSLDELTMMLAGAQLGITACTFALGATAKPSVHYALMPVLEGWGLPTWSADAIAFALALFVMTFLHLVVGEMAPKSWAIAHPETSARAVALPARIFMFIFRPLLVWVNKLANRLVAATGVEPVDQAADASYDAQTLHHLIRHSTQAGTLEESSGEQITQFIALEQRRVDDIIDPQLLQDITLPVTATVSSLQLAAHTTGQLRLLMHEGQGEPVFFVHVRDTLLLPDDSPAMAAARPALTIAAGASVMEALERMRSYSEQLAAVMDGYHLAGVITWDDILSQVWRTHGDRHQEALGTAGPERGGSE